METVNNNEAEVRELVAVEDSSMRFPQCLLNKNSYTGVKGLVGIGFWLGCVYFLYGICNFFLWGGTFWSFLFDFITKPFYLMYHIVIFSTIYCFSWSIFDFQHFKNSFLKFLGIVLPIVYLCLPLDIIPDIIPVFGQADDVIAVIIGLINVFALSKGYKIPNLKKK